LTPRRKTVYLSYPISHVPAELVKDAEEFGHELDAGLIVFNPLAIEDMKLVYALRDVLSASFPHDGARYTLDEHIMAIANRMNDSLKTNKISQQQVVRVIEHLSHQTVARDYRLIAQSDMVIVLYNPTALVVKDPETGDDTDVQKAFLSAGVICEMVFGTANDKDVYAVWPLEEEPSPFFAYNSTKVFKTKEDVVLYLRGAGLM
jgi:hypothetical protein